MNTKTNWGFQERVMLFILLILTVIVSGCVSQVPETSEGSTETQETTVVDSGDFRVVYSPVTNQANLEYERIFKEAQIFENGAQVLNDALILPYDITINIAECGEENAFYNSTTKQIIMCYELIEFISETFDLEELSDDEYKRAIINSEIFIFYHEVGHALRYVLDLPVTGKEEDAVDQLATVILVEGAYPEAALDGAVFFLLNAQNTALEDLAFWDEHSLDEQRFYNIICLVYGSNPEAHSYLVEKDYLPESRAERCPAEYQQSSTSWNRLLSPYLK